MWALDVAYENDTNKYVPVVERMTEPTEREHKIALLWTLQYKSSIFNKWSQRAMDSGLNPSIIIGDIVIENSGCFKF